MSRERKELSVGDCRNDAIGAYNAAHPGATKGGAMNPESFKPTTPADLIGIESLSK